MYSWEESLACTLDEGLNLLVSGVLLVQIKAVQEVHPVHKAQLMSYMKLLDIPVGLLMNFHQIKLVDGVSRMVLPGANQE